MDDSTFGSVWTSTVPNTMLKDVSSSHRTFVSSLSSFVGTGRGKKNPFQYHQLQVHGRETESKLIMEALERICATPTSELVFIRGNRGFGKSAMIESLKEAMILRGAYIVSGKFDPMRKSEPFSAIVEALTDLVDILRSRRHDDDSSYLNELLEIDNAKMLQNLISKLYMNDDDDSVDRIHGSVVLERLASCCCKFLRTVASAQNPVVLNFHAIQWADKSSLDLIKTLINDPSSEHILIICTYRDDEELDSQVRSFLETDFRLPVTDIELTNLDVSSVNKMIADLLDTDAKRTMSLGEVVRRKTFGNPFYVVRYLELLEADGLLKPITCCRWEWDLDRIQSETSVASNVADLVTSKIKRLHVDLQLILKLAACLGSEFDRVLLDSLYIISNLRYTASEGGMDTEYTSQLLSIADDEGLIELKSERKYKFAHDRIQKCLYEMIPDGVEKDLMHLKIGELVWEMAQSGSDPQDWMVFAAANHLNKCKHLSVNETVSRQRLVKINLEAAKLAKKNAAFTSATDFLHAGLTLVEGASKWTEHYELSLPLTTMLAEIMFASGNIPKSKELVREVVDNARSLIEKTRANYTMIDCLATEGQLREATELGFAILRELGEPSPKKPTLACIMWDIFKTKRLLRGMTDEKLLNLPMVTDENTLVRRHVISLVSMYAPFIGDEKQSLMLYLRVVRMCIRDGNSNLSPIAFAMYGMVEAGAGNTKSAYRIGRLCMKMVDKIGNRQCGSLAHSVSRCGLLHWNESIRESLAPLDRSVDMGLSWGRSKDVFFALQVYFSAALHCGEPLEKLEDRMRNCCCAQEQKFSFVQEYNVLLLMLVRPMWQAVLNLQGSTNEPAILSGEALERDDFIKEALDSGNHGALNQFRILQLEIAYRFGDHELAVKTSKELEKGQHMYSFHMCIYSVLLYSGLSYVGIAQKTGEKKYMKKAKKFLKKLEKLNNINSRPFYQVLRAEYYGVLVSNSALTQIRYDEAIATARRAELPNLEALANEIAWSCSMRSNFRQKDYLARAIQLYAHWGAKAKIDSLEHYAHSIPATEGTTKRSRKYKATSNFLDVPELSGIITGPAWAG